MTSVIDAAIGESFAVRARAAALQAALSGLFSAMSSWRTIESHLDERPRFATEVGAKAVLSAIAADTLPGEFAEAAKDPALSPRPVSARRPSAFGSSRRRRL